MDYDEQLYKAIEEENIQYKKILDSREYKLGKKIFLIINNINHLNIKFFLKKIINIKNNINYRKNLAPKNKNNKTYSLYNMKKKIVVYTCITGDYDNILDPLIEEKSCDYILFTNNSFNNRNEGYKIVNIPDNIKEKKLNNILLNRYIKMHPHELFENKYDYSIYIDGNIRCISNISSFINELNDNVGFAMHNHCCRNCIYNESKSLKLLGKGNNKYLDKQITKYEKENFPHNYGMLEANVIVTDLHSNNSKKIFLEWWKEFISSNSLRDQISLPYVLWKNNILVKDVASLGDNVYDNPKIIKIDHKKDIKG